jgi:tRNA threonylcarbamoyladenosine biosynthesis protein TsaE
MLEYDMMLAYKNVNLRQFRALAASLGRQLKGQGAVIGLSGPLGSGKTEFVKAFAKTLKIGKIKSPTFTVINAYPKSNVPFYHVDFYRLTKQAQLVPLGMFELLQSQNRIVLIEWVAKFPKIEKQADLLINFKIKDSRHRDVFIRSKK